jgi:hypothetical protein
MASLSSLPKSASGHTLSPASFKEFILNPYSNDTQMQYVTMQKEFKKSGVDGAWNRLVTEWGHEFFNANVIAQQPHQNADDDTNHVENDVDDDKLAKDRELDFDAKSLEDDDDKPKSKSKSKTGVSSSSITIATTKRPKAVKNVKKRKSPNLKSIADNDIESDDDANENTKKKRIKTK